MSDYWRGRYEELQKALLEPVDKYKKEIEKAYIEASRAIEREIAIWYQRFADNNKVSKSEARKMLDKKELAELMWDIEQYIKAGEENGITKNWEKELENASARWHISRLEALKIQVQQQIEKLYGGREEEVRALLGAIYTEGSYRNAYEIAKRTGANFEFLKIDDNLLNKVLNKPWTKDNKTFSDRIWEDRKALVDTLHKEMIVGIEKGDSSINIAKNISKELNSDLDNTYRLVITESAFFSAEAQKDCYDSLGVEQYEIVGTLDGTTCRGCGSKDSKVYNLKDREVGKNAPPFHPRCRCTTVPYFNDEFTVSEKRAARDEEGNTVYFDNMSYEEWKERFVNEKGQDKWDLYEKSSKNMTRDREQYENYKAVLGKNAPKNLAEFQKIKYNDSKEWEDLKYYYRNIGDRPIEYVKIDRELEKAGITNKGKAYPVEDVEIKHWREHAENRLAGSNLTKSDAVRFKDEAIAIMKRYPEPNTVYDYYHDDGIVGIKVSNNTVQTVIGKDRFKSETATVIEVMKKCLK